MLLKDNETIYRVLDVNDDQVLVIDCKKEIMPVWIEKNTLEGYKEITESEFYDIIHIKPIELSDLDATSAATVQRRFSMIAPILELVGNASKRQEKIRKSAADNGVSKQTIRDYLARYLIHQNMTALAPKKAVHKTSLTQDEKNMRWTLNKYYYTMDKNTLPMAYNQMLKERYCDETSSGVASS